MKGNIYLMKIAKNKKDLKKELYFKILILLILILLVIITSFNTGRKFYLLKHTYFESTNGKVFSGIARWDFKVKITIGNEEEINEQNL